MLAVSETVFGIVVLHERVKFKSLFGNTGIPVDILVIRSVGAVEDYLVHRSVYVNYRYGEGLRSRIEIFGIGTEGNGELTYACAVIYRRTSAFEFFKRKFSGGRVDTDYVEPVVIYVTSVVIYFLEGVSYDFFAVSVFVHAIIIFTVASVNNDIS